MTGRNTAQRTTGVSPLAAFVLALAQWPLSATVREEWLTSTILAVTLLVAGIAAWLCAGGTRARIAALVIGGSALLTLGSYIGFRHAPLTHTLVVATGVWVPATIVLARAHPAWARASLAVSTVLLFAIALELSAGWLARLVPGERADARIGRVAFSGRIEAADPEAERQLLPWGRARHRKDRLDGQPVFEVDYRIDATGGRVVPGRPDNGPDWYLFGDSFTFGEGLEDDQTTAAQLQALHPEAQLFNYGMRGAGPSDAWIHLRRRVAAGAAPAWSFYFFIYDHFRRAAVPPLTAATEGNRPRVVVVNGKPVLLGRADETAQTARERLQVNLLTRSNAYRAFSGSWTPDERSVELVGELGAVMQEEIRQRNPQGQFLFVFLPTRAAPWPDQMARLKLRLRERGVPLLDCESFMREANQRAGRSWDQLFLDDDHPTADYAKLAAACVSQQVSAVDRTGVAGRR